MRKVGFFSLCSVLTGFAGAACGGEHPTAPPPEPAATDGGVREPSPEASPDPAWASDPPLVTDKRPAAVGAPPHAGAPPQADSGSSPPRVPECVPESGTDDPDEDFADTNCDGIDGDASAAVFVAPTGSDDADGSLDAPVKTLGHAIELAAKSGKSVYACDGEYAENVVMTEQAVSLYGGYACDRGWRREKDRATVRPKSGVPLTVKETTTPLVVDRVAFRAPDATGMGQSSIAASVVGAKGVTFRHVLLAAGNATGGEAGAPVDDPRWSPQEPAADAVPLLHAKYCKTNVDRTDLVGDSDPNCASVSKGATGERRHCPFSHYVRGGDGGDGGNYYLGLDAEMGGLAVPVGSANMDGDSIEQRGFAGATAASGFGKIVDGLYVASNGGGDARSGFSGPGGRGGLGGSSPARSDPNPAIGYAPGGGGGQGGYGGCGGPPGKGGNGGGASLALITVDSDVRVDASLLQTDRGGDGGDGSDGGPGQPGGPGGKGAPMPSPSIPGGNGGHGGDGGPGGSGGPGGGGPSIGIVWLGKPIVTKDVTYALGHPGRGGTSLDATAPDGEGVEIYPPLESDAGK